MLLLRKLEGFNKKSWGGRNSLGKITVKNRSGKKDNYYRPLLTEIVPIFIRLELEILSIFKDDFRSTFIMEIIIKNSSLHSLIGLKGYVLAFEGSKPGKIIEFGPKVPSKIGNRTFLSRIVVGTNVFQLEDSLLNNNNSKSKTSFLRSAGSYGTLFSLEEKIKEHREFLSSLSMFSIYDMLGAMSMPNFGFLKLVCQLLANFLKRWIS